MMNAKTMNENLEVLKAYIQTYDRELAVLGAVGTEEAGLMAYEEYMKWYQNMSLDFKLGSICQTAYDDSWVDKLDKLNNGLTTFEEMFGHVSFWDKFVEKMKELEK